jgi:hypothetical protein
LRKTGQYGRREIAPRKGYFHSILSGYRGKEPHFTRQDGGAVECGGLPAGRARVRHLAALAWEFGGAIAGHIVGKYPHEQPPDPKSLELDVHPENHNDMFLRDANGDQRHWILELQFVDPRDKIGGYFEQLL